MRAIYAVAGRNGDVAGLIGGLVSADDLPASGPLEVWAAGSVGLASLPVGSSDGASLWHHPGTGIVVAADARLDDRPGICARLGVDRDAAATEIIGRAYLRWGPGFASELLGDFAFVLWDPRRRELVCGRDYLGVRPLYRATHPEGPLLVAPTVTALTRFVPRVLDLRYMRAEIERRNLYRPVETYHQGISKVRAGHVTVFRGGEPVEHRTWTVPTAKVDLGDDRAYVDRLEELVTTAVADRVASAAKPGFHLSGGLDSSTLAAIGGTMATDAHAFTWTPSIERHPLLDGDERPGVIEIARRSGMTLHHTEVEAEDLLEQDEVDQTLYPFETLRMEWVSSRAAIAEGVDLVLSGWGGDEVAAFNGRGYFPELLLRGRWMRLRREAAARRRVMGGSWRTNAARTVVPLLPAGVAHAVPGVGGMLARRPRPIPKELQSAFSAALHAVEGYGRPTGRERPGVRWMQVRLLTRGHVQNRIDSWADFGMRRGLSYTYPLLDRRVVEWCLGAPPHLFFHEGWKRWMFREFAARHLPAETAWNRHKVDPAMRTWMESARSRSFDEVVRRTEERAADIASCGIVDPQRVTTSARSEGGWSLRVADLLWLSAIGGVSW